jgi:hypothetical protein
MPRSPGTEDAQRINEFFAGTCERIGDLGRGRMRDLTVNNAIRFELTKLGSENLFANAWKKLAKLGEAFRIETQMPDGQDLPFTANGIDGSLNGATVMISQEASILTKKCVLPGGYEMVIPFGQMKKTGHTEESAACLLEETESDFDYGGERHGRKNGAGGSCT